MLYKKLTYDYIRGLVGGKGIFTFSTYKAQKKKIPSFQLKMNAKDVELMQRVVETMGLDSRVYVYNYQGNDGHKRQRQATLIVRELGNLKNIVAPFFYNRLAGNKASQFEDWLERIGHDPLVPESYKIIYRLHENGYYKKNPKFL